MLLVARIAGRLRRSAPNTSCWSYLGRERPGPGLVTYGTGEKFEELDGRSSAILARHVILVRPSLRCENFMENADELDTRCGLLSSRRHRYPAQPKSGGRWKSIDQLETTRRGVYFPARIPCTCDFSNNLDPALPYDSVARGNKGIIQVGRNRGGLRPGKTSSWKP
jgi:hypothetical protein